MMEADLGYHRRLLKTSLLIFFFATLILAGEFLLYSVRWIVLTIGIGLCTGVLLTPTIDCLERNLRFPRSLGALIVLGFAIILTALLGAVIFSLLADQAELIQQRLLDIITNVSRSFENFFSLHPWIKPDASTLNLQEIAKGLMQRTFQGARMGGAAVASLVLIFVIAAYISVAPAYYLQLALNMVPVKNRSEAESTLLQIGNNLRRWFSCQLIAMVTVGAFTTLGLWLIGLDDWLLFGCLAGILDVIPYLGPTIPALGAVAVSLAGAPAKVPWILGLFILVHQLENNFLIPMIFKARMKFPPVLLITAMLVLGKLFGFIGLVITPPLFTIIQTVATRFWLRDRSEPTPST